MDASNTSSVFKIMWREIYGDKLALAGFILFTLIVATVYVWAAMIDPAEAGIVNLLNRNGAPAPGHILGFDSAGRDMLWQLILSARVSFNIAFIVTFAGVAMGMLFGLVAGYYGGHVDNVLMRVLDFYAMVPTIMLVIVLVVTIPNYTVTTFIVLMIVLVTWQSTARLIRIKALQQGALDYVSASKTLGTPNIVIIFREVFPNLISIVTSNFTLQLAFNMGIETGLTFLGFGLPFGNPSLGRLVFYAAVPANMLNRPWQWLPAALLIIIMMLCINFVGQALNRAADAKKRTV